MSTRPTRFVIDLKAWLRRDALPIFLYVVLTLAMTYPLIAKMGTGWIGGRDEDTYVKLWDQWWLSRIFESGRPLLHSFDLFHPIGVDLSYHSISWTAAAFARLLSPMLGEIDAYNATILFALFTSAYAAYLLLLDWLGHREAAWLAGLIYAFAPYHVAHTGGHPDLVHLAPIPLFVLFLRRGLKTGSVRSALAAAFFLGVAAFTGLYIMMMALLAGGPLFLFELISERRWRQTPTRRAAIAFLVASTLLLAARTAPVLHSRSALSAAIEQKSEAAKKQTDALSFVTPPDHNPLFAPYFAERAKRFVMNRKWPAYLGAIPLALASFAIFNARQLAAPGFLWLWFGIGVQFFFLSLGPVLRFGGHVYSEFALPAAYLSWLPPIRAVGRPDYFVLGLLLPLSVGAGFGFERLREIVGDRKRLWTSILLATTLLVSIEYWNGPYRGKTFTVSPFYLQLAGEPANEAIIELPMGRNTSKHYVFYQTIHGHPMVEGLTARTPAAAFDYIKANLLLRKWKNSKLLVCTPLSPAAYRHSLDSLVADHFRYVIVHLEKARMPRRFADYFKHVSPLYHDRSVSVFEIETMRQRPPCSRRKATIPASKNFPEVY